MYKYIGLYIFSLFSYNMLLIIVVNIIYIIIIIVITCFSFLLWLKEVLASSPSVLGVFESNEPCAFLIECWSACRRLMTKKTTVMMMMSISVCRSKMVDPSAPAAGLVLTAGEEGSGSGRDGTE